jgi:tetratricopeptide (TPR) repeat protein
LHFVQYKKWDSSMIVYKYRRDADTTESIFTSKKVWLSTPAALNDPFESELRPIDPALRAAKTSEMKQAQLAGFLLQALGAKKTGGFFGLTKLEVAGLLDRFSTFSDLDEAYAEYANFIKGRIGNPPSDPEKMFSQLPAQMSGVGIFSLSEVPDNLLMWAHYAGDHSGLSLGFEVTDGSALASDEHCLHVDYSGVVPKLHENFHQQLNITLDSRGGLQSSSRIAFSDPVLRAAISTKGPEWEYEREWRYVEPSAGAFDWPGPIVEITFGLRCAQERRDYYVKLAEEFIPNDVRFYEMRKVPDTKSMQRVRLLPPVVERVAAAALPSVTQLEKLLKNGRYIEALAMVDQLIAGAPGSAELWRCKGLALGWSEDHEAALSCFEQAISLQPDFFSAWYQKGVALMVLSRFDEAIDAYSEAKRLCAREPSVAYNLGSVLAHLKRYDEALVQLKDAKKLGHPRAAHKLKSVKALCKTVTP